MLVEYVPIGSIDLIFSINNEVDVWLNFPDCINYIVSYFHLIFERHFSELSFGVVSEVEV